MKINTSDLIAELIAKTKMNLNVVERLKNLSTADLNAKANPESWSILECIEHLNRYGDFYLPEITKRLNAAQTDPAATIFKSGWLGNYFAESMRPKEKLNKMKTFKSMNPVNSKLQRDVLDKFTLQQKEILKLLDKARQFDLSKIKTPISISSWIKLRLGDTFRVVIYHNERHVAQAEQVLSLVKSTSVS